MRVKYSIVIPVYNGSLYLRKCLESVIVQTYDSWEAICVDDGSTDGSGAILDEYAARDARIRVIHQKNMGVSAARNAGLDVAKGGWVSFVDADDSVMPDYLESFDKFEDKKDIVFFEAREDYSDGHSNVVEIPWCEKCSFSENLRSIAGFPHGRNMMGFTWNKFFKNKIIQVGNVRFPFGISISEDELFTLNYCAYARSLAVLPKVLYCYRRNDTGLTAQRNVDYFELANVFLKLANLYNDRLLREYATTRACSSFLAGVKQTKSMDSLNAFVRMFDSHRDFIVGRGGIIRFLRGFSAAPCWVKSCLLGLYLYIRRS